MGVFTGAAGPGHLCEALVHFNEALDRKESGAKLTDVARLLSDALNKLQTEWCVQHGDSKAGEVKSFQLMITSSLQGDKCAEFLKSNELRSLVLLDPQVMDHATLRRRGWRPGHITPELSKEATEKHRKLVNAWKEFENSHSRELEERVVKKAAELIYIVRSNISHGEKTPYGPDNDKQKRDEDVSRTVVPLQLKLLDLLLDRPTQRLVAYGTLAPGQANHSLLAEVDGSWQDCEVCGSLADCGGLIVLHWDPQGGPVAARLLTSPRLSERWERLETFEGKNYKRRLVLARAGAAEWCAAYAFVS